MYIHELSDWPRFEWSQKQLLEPLAGVCYSQGRLIGYMEATSFDLRQKAVLRTLTAEAVTSSDIEGEELDTDQVHSLLARRLGLDSGTRNPAEKGANGIVEVLLDATRGYDQPLTVERLHSWQASLFPTGRSGAREISVGVWRDDSRGPMRVVSGPLGNERVRYEAPRAERLDAEVAAFMAWFNAATGIDPVLKAALAHLWFMTIHPFDDGNGRIARAITEMALARCENSPERFYSLSTQIRKDRDAYYDILERTQNGSLNVTAWMQWFIDRLGRAIDDARTLLDTVPTKPYLQEPAAEIALNHRQRQVLNDLRGGFEARITTSEYAKLAKCSQDTALRDITCLVERGVLIRGQEGGRSTRYALGGLGIEDRAQAP